METVKIVVELIVSSQKGELPTDEEIADELVTAMEPSDDDEFYILAATVLNRTGEL